MNANGWEQLGCKYFAETCREILSEYLEHRKFRETRLTNGSGVVYSRTDTFLEIGYDTHLYPEYTTLIAVGIIEGGGKNKGGSSRVPMWYIIPKDHRTRGHWRFRSRDELARVLEEVRAALETTLIPLLANRGELERLIGDFQREVDSNRQEEYARHNDTICRTNATKAFSEKDYGKFVQEMSKIPEERRSAAEVKKLSYALRQVNK